MVSPILHIASFIVQHRPDAADALDQALAALPDTELALREGGRSIVLCEAAKETLLLDRMDVLKEVDGVVGVSLVHHHAESQDQLLQEMTDAHPS